MLFPLLCSVTRTVSETVPNGNEFVLARLIRTELLLTGRLSRLKGGSPMSAPVLGIDIAKQRIEVALLVDGKVKNKSFKNTTEGFEALALWLRKLEIPQVQACLEATGNYGEELAIYLYEAGHSVSIVNPARIKGFSQSELIRTKTDKIDAGIIARFCLAMRPKAWVPPSPEV